MLKLLTGWQGYAASAILAALLTSGATFYATSLGYRLTIANMEKANAQADAKNADAALAQFSNDAAKIHDAALAYGDMKAGLDGKFAAISKEFANAIKNRPLPLDCRPDADRLHSLSQAVAAANAAAGLKFVPAVPANP